MPIMGTTWGGKGSGILRIVEINIPGGGGELEHARVKHCRWHARVNTCMYVYIIHVCNVHTRVCVHVCVCVVCV
jgi:hypothetical protein